MTENKLIPTVDELHTYHLVSKNGVKYSVFSYQWGKQWCTAIDIEEGRSISYGFLPLYISASCKQEAFENHKRFLLLVKSLGAKVRGSLIPYGGEYDGY